MYSGTVTYIFIMFMHYQFQLFLDDLDIGTDMKSKQWLGQTCYTSNSHTNFTTLPHLCVQ